MLLLFLFLLITQSFSQIQTEIGNIDVIIQDIDTEEEGKLLVILFNSETSWLEYGQHYKMLKVQPNKETQKVTYENIHYGSAYAIEIIHDENDNQKLDMRILPYPKAKEGFGSSNNTFRAGPPEYDKARFTLDQPVAELFIQMKY